MALRLLAGLLMLSLLVSCKKEDAAPAGPPVNSWTINGKTYTAAQVRRATVSQKISYTATTASGTENINFVFDAAPSEGGSFAIGDYPGGMQLSGVLNGNVYFNAGTSVQQKATVANTGGKASITVPEITLQASNGEALLISCNAITEQ